MRVRSVTWLRSSLAATALSRDGQLRRTASPWRACPTRCKFGWGRPLKDRDVRDAAEAERLDEEQRLIAEAQAGRLDALRVVLSRHADSLFSSVILPRLGNGAAAEGVLRETVATALEKTASFRWEGKGIYGWLRQIAQNKIIAHHRRSQRTSRVLRDLALEPVAPSPCADESLIAEEDRRRDRSR